jgi:hypothetical protein
MVPRRVCHESSGALATPDAVRRLAGLALCLIGAACSGSSPTAMQDQPMASPATFVGVFALRTIDGRPVPTTLSDNVAGKLEVLDEAYTLRTDHSYSRTQRYRQTPADGTATEGSFTQNGTFDEGSGTVAFHGTASGIAFTVTASRTADEFVVTLSQTNQVLVYRRQ